MGLPELSNFCCLPGRAGGSPNGLEADLIRERTRAGLDAARRRGKKLGRPRAQRSPQLLARVRRMRRSGRSLSQIATTLDVSKSMAAKLVREAAA